MRRLKKVEATAFKKRWAAVRAADVAELRATPMAEKLRQLIALMSSAEQLGWSGALAAEESEVRARWQQLRKTARG